MFFYRQIPFWKSDEIDSYDLPITVYSYDSLLADHNWINLKTWIVKQIKICAHLTVVWGITEDQLAIVTRKGILL